MNQFRLYSESMFVEVRKMEWEFLNGTETVKEEEDVFQGEKVTSTMLHYKHYKHYYKHYIAPQTLYNIHF